MYIVIFVLILHHYQECLYCVSLTDCPGIAALNFAYLFSCIQLINNQHINCLDLLLTVVSGVLDHILGDSDHSSISFSVKMNFKIPNISFSCKVYFKSRVDWPCVGNDLLNHNRNVVYKSPNPVSELIKVITSLIDRRVPSKVIRRKMNDKPWFNKDGCFHSL